MKPTFKIIRTHAAYIKVAPSADFMQESDSCSGKHMET